MRSRSPSCDTSAGTWGDAQASRESPLLVVVDRQAPGLHQFQVGAADQDWFDPSLVERHQLTRLADLTRVARIEEQQVADKGTTSSGFLRVPAANSSSPLAPRRLRSSVKPGSK